MKSSLAAGSLIALALALSACGSSGGGTGSTTQPVSSAGASTPASSTSSSTATATTPVATSTTAAPTTSTSTAPAPSTPSTKSAGTRTSTAPSSSRAAHINNSASSPSRAGGIQNFGEPASAAERETVNAMVKRYYAALVSGDGTTACSLLTARLNHSLAASLSHASGKRPKGCAGIMSLLFKHRPGQNDSALREVQVVGMRIRGNRGFALLRSKTASELPLVREGGQWKIGSLVGGELP